MSLSWSTHQLVCALPASTVWDCQAKCKGQNGDLYALGVCVCLPGLIVLECMAVKTILTGEEQAESGVSVNMDLDATVGVSFDFSEMLR